MIWNVDDKLLYQNRFSYAFQEQTFGSAFELGQAYKDRLNWLVENGYIAIPDNMSKSQVIDKMLLERKNISFQEGELAHANHLERKFGRTTFLTSATRLKDGSLLQTFSDITEQRDRESQLQRLSDGINTISNGLVFWDEKQELVFCNEVVAEFSKKQGFEMVPGVKREDMRKHLVANGMVPGESGDEILTEDKIKNQLKKVGTAEREQVYSDGTVLLFSDKTFPDVPTSLPSWHHAILLSSS